MYKIQGFAILLILSLSGSAWALSPEAEAKAEAMISAYEDMAQGLEDAAPDCAKMAESLMDFYQVRGAELDALEAYMGNLTPEDQAAMEERYALRLEGAMTMLLSNVMMCADDPAFMKAMEAMDGGGSAAEPAPVPEPIEEKKGTNIEVGGAIDSFMNKGDGGTASKGDVERASAEGVLRFLEVLEAFAVLAEAQKSVGCQAQLEALMMMLSEREAEIDAIIVEVKKDDWLSSADEKWFDELNTRINAALSGCEQGQELYFALLTRLE